METCLEVTGLQNVSNAFYQFKIIFLKRKTQCSCLWVGGSGSRRVPLCVCVCVWGGGGVEGVQARVCVFE